jgi:hypothetical protein
MKTYLMVWFSSEGARPSDVMQRLMGLGFKPMKGNYDFLYEWGSIPKVEEIINLGDEVQLTLKKMNVLFKLETI